MELGFIQAAAPASSPVPLADAATAADSFTQAGGAFDAALAATLQAVAANAGGTGAPAKGAQASQAWQLTSLFMSSTLAAPVTPAAEGEAAPAEGSAAAADAPAETGPPIVAEDLTASAAVVVPLPVPMPVVADVNAAMIPQDLAAAARDASNVPAGQPDPAASGAAVGTAIVPARDDARGDQQATAADGSARAAAPVSLVRQDQPAATTGTQADVSTGHGQAPDESGKGPVEAPAAAAAGKPVSNDSPRAQATRHVQAARPESVDMTAQPTVVQRGVIEQAAAAPAAAVTIVAAIDSMAARASAPVGESGRAEPAESGAGLQPDITSDSLSGNDASMTGDDASGGQSRPSPEFLRFAAALAQVSPATDEPRAAAAVVAPTTSGTTATSSTTAAAAAPPPAPVATTETPGAENVGRLVQAMRVIARPGAWEATVRLNPEHLGDVSIALRVERNSVSAVVNAESAGVRQWLESQEQTVRSGMAEHGLQLDRFIVQRDGQRRDAEAQQQQESPRRQPRQRQSTTQRFEIVV